MTQKPLLSYLLLGLITLAFYLPGAFLLPVIDRDEALFAQASKQMLESGDYLNIQFQDRARLNKPAGIYWLQSATVKTIEVLTGQDVSSKIWAYRLPSVLGCVLAVLLTFALGRRLFDQRTAFLGALLLGTSLMLLMQAIQARVDAVLLAVVMLAQLTLAKAWINSETVQRNGLGNALLFWVAQGIGLLLKGPIVLIITLLTIITLVIVQKQFRWINTLRPLWGWIIPVMMVVPWFIAIQQASHGAFLESSVGKDFLPKLFSGQESHGAPPGYYLLTGLLLLFPAVWVFPSAIKTIWKAKKINRSVLFCLCWLIPGWILFELVPTKLPHYVMPVYPALTLLIAWAVLSLQPEANRQLPVWIGAILGIVLSTVFAVAAPLAAIHFSGLILWTYFIPSAVIVLGAALTVMFLFKQEYLQTLITSIISFALCLVSLFIWIIPSLSDLWVSDKIKMFLQSHQLTEKPLIVTGYSEPSVVFINGTNTDIVIGRNPGKTAAEKLLDYKSAHHDAVALIEAQHVDSFLTEVRTLKICADFIGQISGFNYTKGKNVALDAYHLCDTPQ